MKDKQPYKSRTLLICFAVGLIAFGMAQLYAPVIDNPPISNEIALPNQVSKILKRACYDCHSNETKNVWYDRIFPASYFIAKDVKLGRASFNFSEWNKNPTAVQELLLWEMVNAIQHDKMPLKDYTFAHSDANVTSSELAVLKEYVNSLPVRHKVDTAQIMEPISISAAQLAILDAQIPASLNGVRYSSAYKKWKIISLTDKFDGGSMRIVYANDIMIKAIKSGKLPFPDGAEMVKAVWGKKQVDENGIVRPGNFQNLQFMIKDRKRFKETEGWGFAKFDGLKLKAYGKTPAFDKTCISCHRLLASESDFVFNVPTKKSK